MAQFPGGVENRYRPRILITPIDSKKAFMRLANPWHPEEWKENGKAHFLDLHTLLWALYNKSYSLKRACDNESGPFKGQDLPQKKDHEPTGRVTPDEIEYARQDGRCTVALLKPPRIIRAIRVVHQGKQAGMETVKLRGSMVEIDPYKDDLFRKVIEERKRNKADKALYYWLKILANSIYGFFVELIPETQKKNVPVKVFSGEKHFPDDSDVIEKSGKWFFPPLASLITSAGRLLLAMTESCVEEKQGTHLFCDTDSLAIVSSQDGGELAIPGSEGKRILSWHDVNEIAERFASLNPYDPEAVEGSILNRVDANFTDSDPKNEQRQLYGYSILFIP